MIILIVIHIFLLSNLQFTAWPEMLSFSYMIDNGFVIYKDFHHVYQPLLTFTLLSFFKIFGFNIISLKTFTYILIALTDLFVFLNVKKLTDKQSLPLRGKNNLSIFTLSLYVLLQPIFDGNMLWYDIAVILPVLISIYYIDVNLFVSGFFIAIAFLTKQQAILIGLPIFIYLLISKIKFKDIIKFGYGCITPIIFLVLFLYKFDLFPDYLFWTFEFPLIHLPNIDGYAVSPNSRELVILGMMVVSLIVGIITNYKKLNSKFYLLLSILFFLILSAFPRFSLFHLQPALAIYVLIIGYLFSLRNKYFILLLIPVFLMWKNVLVTAKYEDRFYTQSDVNTASEIKNRSKDSQIYLLGPSSIEYVLSSTVPPKPWIENYVWHFEMPGMQEKMIEGWKVAPPQYIYWSIPQSGNWYDLGTYQPKEVVKYIKDNYQKIDQQENIEIWKLQ